MPKQAKLMLEPSSLDLLFQRTREYRDSQNFKAMGEFLIRLRDIAPFNAFLLWQQNPDIAYAATHHDWERRFGRTPKTGARPYVILRAFGPVDFVYDVHDTDGPPLPADIAAFFRAEGQFDPKGWQTLVHNCLQNDIEVRHDSSLMLRQAGWAANTARSRENAAFSLAVNPRHEPTVQFAALAHELGHILLGHLGGRPGVWGGRFALTEEICEIEAEAVSWLVCERMGLQTDADRYLSGYLKSGEIPPAVSLDRVLTVAGKIESMTKRIVSLKPKAPQGVGVENG